MNAITADARRRVDCTMVSIRLQRTQAPLARHTAVDPVRTDTKVFWTLTMQGRILLPGIVAKDAGKLENELIRVVSALLGFALLMVALKSPHWLFSFSILRGSPDAQAFAPVMNAVHPAMAKV